MKSLIQLLFLLSLSAALSAQVVQVKSVQRVAVPDTVAHQTGKVAGIEPDGRHISAASPASLCSSSPSSTPAFPPASSPASLLAKSVYEKKKKGSLRLKRCSVHVAFM